MISRWSLKWVRFNWNVLSLLIFLMHRIFFLNSHKLSFSLMLFPFSFLSPSPDLPPHPTFVSEITLYTIFSLDDSDWKQADYAHHGILCQVLFEYFFSNRLSARWHCCEFWWDGESTVTYVSKTPSLLISNSRVDQFYLCIEERRSFGIWKALSFLLRTGNFAVGLIHKYLLSTNYMQGTVLGRHPHYIHERTCYLPLDTPSQV